MSRIFKLLWIGFCMFAGAGIGAVLAGMVFESTILAVAGGVVGAILGGLFGAKVPMLDLLETWLG